MKNMCSKTLSWVVLSLSISSLSALAGGYTNTFTTDPSAGTSPVTFKGSAHWVSTGGPDGDGYVSLTDATGGQQGKMILPDFDSGAPVLSYNVKMKVRIGGGNSRPADGINISFVP